MTWICKNESGMIEVFKTDITSQVVANWLRDEIQASFAGYQVNFDLSDCDKILRVVYNKQAFHCKQFTSWLKARGCHAEVLPDY